MPGDGSVEFKQWNRVYCSGMRTLSLLYNCFFLRRPLDSFIDFPSRCSGCGISPFIVLFVFLSVIGALSEGM
jgi:hypothetical protein